MNGLNRAWFGLINNLLTGLFLRSASSKNKFPSIIRISSKVSVLIAAVLLFWTSTPAFAGTPGGGPAQAGITFSNFSQTVTLSPLADGNYSLNGGIRVKLADRLVVKAAVGVDKGSLHRIDPRITDVTELYRLDSGCYYAAAFSGTKDLPDILECFKSSPVIISAQPDILQARDKSSRAAKPGQPLDYLSALDIPAMWKKSRGRGVKIAVIDDGFALDHEDLRGVTVAFGYDVENRTLDPAPKTDLDIHGTEVTGIIFARHNATGIDGIAPEAELIALRQPDTWTSLTILSFNLARLAGADIINCSWTSRVFLEPVADTIADLTTKGRDGKGIAVVFAAGNQGQYLAADSTEAALPGVIAVGTLGRNGNRMGFSNFGERVAVYTYGSDILTTSRGPRKYTRFSGTSASAAIVSGVIALYLSRDQDLSVADIKKKIASAFGCRERYATK